MENLPKAKDKYSIYFDIHINGKLAVNHIPPSCRVLSYFYSDDIFVMRFIPPNNLLSVVHCWLGATLDNMER